MKKIFEWLFSLHPRKEFNSEIEKFMFNVRTTAHCRYNASVRLQRLGKFSFFTLIFLSLGLVFIPLMQNANIKLEIANNVINMMQIFLAVAVLVFSISISTSRYELRAETLRECGDKLKELIRELSKEQEFEQISKEKLTIYQKRYTDVTTDSENHESIDYKVAIIDMNNDFIITGFKRLFLKIEIFLNNFIIKIIPILLITFEIIFITDIFGLTTVFTKYLQTY
ncbi:SLATT domain-containing protein [Aliarcobacter butzleri]|uniref:SLATT domain-containing protein n=2 Tax=Aliarcobacter butzleri TaxID=28197 RepID=UPI003B211091